MIINYRFVDGETAQVEVSDEIGNVIIESRRAEETVEREARRHCFSIDALEYEGIDFAVYDTLFKAEDELEEHKRMAAIKRVFNSLTKKQRRRICLYINGKTIREIAEIEGTTVRAIHDSIRLSREKFLKISVEDTQQNPVFCPYSEEGIRERR